MNMTASARRTCASLVCALFFMAAATAVCRADIQGTVVKNDGGRLSGRIRYMVASREFMVTTGQVSLRVPQDQVARVEVPAPPELDQAARAVRSGQFDAAVPVLETIVREYRLMGHDLTAAGYLARAYMAMNQPAKALDMCNKTIEGSPEAAYTGALAPVYWEALLAVGRQTELGKVLDEAIARGDRATAARAQLMRGDMEARNGRFREALVDGYLRTAVLFRDVREVQPEALFKAAQSFDQLEQHAHAETMRKELLAKYPNDEYSRKLRAGASGGS